MILDNLKDINSVADLFRYIADLEDTNEKQKQLIDVLLVDKDRLITANLDLKDKLEKSEGLLSFYESKMVTKEAE
jgi:hypothetical protein